MRMILVLSCLLLSPVMIFNMNVRGASQRSCCSVCSVSPFEFHNEIGQNASGQSGTCMKRSKNSSCAGHEREVNEKVTSKRRLENYKSSQEKKAVETSGEGHTGGDSGANPGSAGWIMSLCWFGNTSVLPRGDLMSWRRWPG